MPVVWKFEFEEPLSAHFKETEQVWMIKKMDSFISSIVPNLSLIFYLSKILGK